MQIIINTIPHDKQPYNTIGDWRFSDDYSTCFINVSDMGDVDYNNAVALHETVEIMALLRKMPPKEAVDSIDAFDIEFEKNRTDNFENDPGDDPKCPAHIEHGYATAAERMYLALCGKNWKQYEDTQIALMKTYGTKTN